MHELIGHLMRNEEMWKQWEHNGVRADTLLTVDFHFDATDEEGMKKLTKELTDAGVSFKVREFRKLVFLKQWDVEANVTQKWTLPQLQETTGQMLALAQRAGVGLDGCGALLPS